MILEELTQDDRTVAACPIRKLGKLNAEIANQLRRIQTFKRMTHN